MFVNQVAARQRQKQQGFTLVELLVSTVVALVVLGGLLVSFQSQYSEYKYQNKRVDAAQDLEFVMNFVAADLKSSLLTDPVGLVDPNPTNNNQFTGAGASTSLTFWVWDPSEVGIDVSTKLAQRLYSFDAVNDTLSYDRIIQSRDNAGTLLARANSPSEILEQVTFFKVFRDDVDVATRGLFSGAPQPLSSRTVLDSQGNSVTVPSYTILIEVGVDAGYKNGAFLDVLGNDQQPGVGDGHKRIWRYIQVQPRSMNQ
ncbi:MAG: prepilin-type N-terminal cleavage/methylation domain-containing protein [Mariprofundaceae bacterium]